MADSDLDTALQQLRDAVQKYDDATAGIEPLRVAVVDSARRVITSAGGFPPAGPLPAAPAGVEGGGGEAGGAGAEPPAGETAAPPPPPGPDHLMRAGPPPTPQHPPGSRSRQPK